MQWGTYTGWVLSTNCCYYQGTFVWSGTPDNYIFTADPNPYGDNYIGNEPRCMTPDQCNNLS